MDDQSPLSPGQSSTRTAPGHQWIASADDYFLANVPASHHGSTAFTYGNWEEWMRWDGVAESLSPRQLHISPPAYRDNKITSPPLQHGPVISPGGIIGPDHSFNQVPMSAMDVSPFTFYNDTNQADYRFSDAMNSTPDQSSPGEYGFRPDVGSWDAPPQRPPLTREERQHLRNIAFQRTSSHESHQSHGSAGEVNRAVSASPEPAGANSLGKKRKSSGEDSITQNLANPTPGKKTSSSSAHNMIEKRYRTNLNDKIGNLRDSIPSLRAKAAPGTIEGDQDREEQGLCPAHKMNKATILSKATEYIHHLERKNQHLEDENISLRARIRAFEKLTIAGSIGTGSIPGGTSIPPRIQGPPFGEGEDRNTIGMPRPFALEV